MTAMSVLRGVYKKQKRRGGAGDIQQGPRDFSLSCTCPPSTSVVFRGGLAWWSSAAFWPTGFIIPTYEVDLADPAKCSVLRGNDGVTYTFTNAYWYVSVLVILSDDLWTPPEHPPFPDTVPDDAIEFYSGTLVDPYMIEYETATEAEQGLRTISGDYASKYGIVAGGLVIRNNGDTINYNQYQPIDPINRGRSYLFGSRRYGWQMG